MISGGPSTLYKNLPPRVDSSCQETLRVLGPLRSLLVVIGVFFSFFLKHNELLLSGLLYIAQFFLKKFDFRLRDTLKIDAHQSDLSSVTLFGCHFTTSDGG